MGKKRRYHTGFASHFPKRSRLGGFSPSDVPLDGIQRVNDGFDASQGETYTYQEQPWMNTNTRYVMNFTANGNEVRFNNSMLPVGESSLHKIPSNIRIEGDFESNCFGSQITGKAKAFDLEYLIKLDEYQTSELTIALGRDSDRLYLTIDQIKRDPFPRLRVLDLLLKLLGRVLYSDFTENVTAILETVHDSAFFGPFIIYKYLRRIDHPSTHQDVRRSQQSLETLCRVLLGIYQYLPRGEIEKYWETEAILCGIISKLASVHTEFSIDKYTMPLIRRLAFKSSPRLIPQESNKSSSSLDSNHLEFMNDIILPTKENLTINPVLFKNKKKGPYSSVAEYLSVQFLLLKEDFLRPFRQGIQEFQKHQNENSGTKFHSSDIKVFQNARIIEIVCDNKGILHSIQFDVQKRHLNFLSRRFIYGSLICLWEESKDILLFATVANRDDKKIQRGIIDVIFEGQSYFMVKNVSEGDSFHMIESPGYYESYRHVLQGIQQFAKAEVDYKRQINGSMPHNNLEMDLDQKDTELHNKPQSDNSAGLPSKEDKDLSSEKVILDVIHAAELEKFDRGRLPFQNYIVRIDQSTHPPKYLRKDHITYDLSVLLQRGLESVDIFDTLAWPTAQDLGLDEAQLEALRYALTHELALIQGPPGCGKTFLGLKIVDVLLKNRRKWLDNAHHNNPILVVCYTNHALDQFLNGVLTLKPSKGNGKYPIVRVGSRCKDEAFEPYLLKNLKKQQRRRNDGYFRLRNHKEEIEKYKLYLKESFEGIVQIDPIIAVIASGDRGIDQMFCAQMRQLLPEEIPFPNPERIMLDWLCPEMLLHSNGRCDERPRGLNQKVYNNEPEEQFFDRTDADYEQIQRMIDEDFDIFENVDHNSSLIDKHTLSAFQCEVFHRNVCQVQPMTDEELNLIKDIDIWQLEVTKRWNLYQSWILVYRNKLQEKLKRLYVSFQRATRIYQEATLHAEEDIFNEAQVLGMTTTTAAKYRSVLQRVAPKIVIIEEAAEVLEGHVITSLSAGCQHLILIGDQQQLRPKPTTYELEKNFNLGLSLFERLINNDIPYKKLETQHRMRPIISSLLVPHFYPILKNGSKVKEYEDIRGVKENMFFLNHSKEEDKMEFGTSHSNDHEARFLVSFAFYLQHQGYNASEITIVTAYHAQASLIRKIFKLEAEIMPIKREYTGPHKVCEVHVTPIDNYQGEENEIILLSLVRSNKEEKLGFINEWNRICVALSRAKKGFYAMGNFTMAERKSKKWKSILGDIRQKENNDHCFLGDSLVLKCCNHGDQPYLTDVAIAKDFDEIIDGSCKQRCGVQMDCGHVCRRCCHSDDNGHIWGQSKCLQSCRIPCTNGHPCKLKCSSGCVPCDVLVTKYLTKCKHNQDVECHLPEDKVTCKKPCEMFLVCGHRCKERCGRFCTSSCTELVEVDLKCGHKKQTKCGKREEDIICQRDVKITLPCKHECQTKCFIGDDAKCLQPCNEVLQCGHKCQGTCNSCHTGRLHNVCKEPCKRILVCGHECRATCSESCPPCELPCKKGCEHAQCPKRCGDPCIACREPCTIGCKHMKCTKMCFEKCDITPCNMKCPRSVKFSCCKKKHNCIGLCGEPHPKCHHCNSKTIRDIFFGEEDEKDARFIQLEECKHIFEVKGLDKWMAQGSNEGGESIHFKRCPKCQTTITKSKRYANDIKTMNNDIMAIKQKITNWDESKKKELTAFKKDLEDDDKLPQTMKKEILFNLEKQIKRVKTSNIIVVVRNQYNFAVHVSKLMKKIDAFFGKDNSKCQKMLSELRKIGEWATNERRTFSDQEMKEFRAELERLRLKTDLVLIETTLQDLEVTLEDKLGKKWKKITKMLYSVAPLSFEKSKSIEEVLKAVGKKHKIGLGISDDERLMILKAMDFRGKGHWYKCPKGHLYAIGDCGGATVESTCPECNSAIGGASHRLRSDNAVASEMDGATHPAWSEQANMANYPDLYLL